jgi:hypothetical protein
MSITITREFLDGIISIENRASSIRNSISLLGIPLVRIGIVQSVIARSGEDKYRFRVYNSEGDRDLVFERLQAMFLAYPYTTSVHNLMPALEQTMSSSPIEPRECCCIL